jgi:hypothetical protein
MINRREFIKMMAVTGLLAACNPKQIEATPTDVLPTLTPVPTTKPTEEETVDTYIAYCGHGGCPSCPNYGKKCDGCLTDGDVLTQYAVNCAVRNCNVEKNVLNCAYCEEYACDKLNAMFAEWQQGGFGQVAEQAQATLEEIHRSLAP